MGKTILTPIQHQFLEFVTNQPQITDNFYLTGGTALSEFYYQHRKSEDIDLFCEKQEVDQILIEAFIKKHAKSLGVIDYKISQFLGLVSFLLVYKNAQLKVDFNFYPFPQVEKGKVFKTLRIDSVYDIAVNKVHTLFMKARSRDFIDLYFILKRENYPLERLITDAKVKFDWHIDSATLGSQFLRAGEFPEYPTMFVSFDKKDMVSFFDTLGKKLKKDILV